MENLNMALLSSSSPKFVMVNPTSLKNRTPEFSSSRPFPFLLRNYWIAPRASRISVSADHGYKSYLRIFQNVAERFASISSSTGEQRASVGVNPQPVLPPPSNVGSPLFWVGVGVALSAGFSWVAGYLKNYAMQQAFKTLMNQMNTQNSQNNPTGSPSAFPAAPVSGPAASPAFSVSSATDNVTSPSYRTSSSSSSTASPSPVASQPAITVDVAATEVKSTSPPTDVKDETEMKKEPKKYAFVDVSPEETLVNSPFSRVEDASETILSKDAQFSTKVTQNGTMFKQGPNAYEESQSNRKPGPLFSVNDLEKMMENPTVQKMVYPYLPEEMRNPDTFKWIIQNPQYRQQLQDMLNNMGGSGDWDNSLKESLKNFDLNSPEIKQQFDQIGLTPEEVVSKIMANPDVAMAFQNPRVQQAIMECSQNPLSITKYQNDKEVMDVFNKISELFPSISNQ